MRLFAAEKGKERAAEQQVAHKAWKNEYFISRPPPPPRDRLHRLNHHEGRYSGVHTTFEMARRIVKEEGRVAGPRASSPSPTPCAPTRQEEWLHQMNSERAKWNPHADLQIRTDPGRTVIMYDIPQDAEEADLHSFADQFGRVTRCRVVRHRLTAKSRGYGFVEFGLPAEALKAVSFSRQRRLKGRRIAAAMERGRTDTKFLPKRLARAAEITASSPAKVRTQKATVTPCDGDFEVKPQNLFGVLSACDTAQDDDEAFLDALFSDR